MTDPRFERALAAIDAANAADPTRIEWHGESQPKELVHAELVSGWVRRLRPDASPELLLAARAHHVGRWLIARSSYPPGRAGYLRWRRTLHDLHAERVAEILTAVGYDGSGDYLIDASGCPHRRGEREVAPFLFAGLQLLHRRAFAGISDRVFSLVRLFDRAEAAGCLHAIVHDGEWYHIGTPQGLAATRERLSSLRIGR